jgi:hypothetical protein
MTPDEIQAAADLVVARGYVGTRTDPTDDVAYTVAGVTAGLTVPSAHDRMAISCRAAVTDDNAQTHDVGGGYDPLDAAMGRERPGPVSAQPRFLNGPHGR